MQPDHIHFAAVIKSSGANVGVPKKAIAPFQCSLAEAAQVVDEVAILSTYTKQPSDRIEVDTAAVGPFCVFFTGNNISNSSALVIVGTKSWRCSSAILSFIRRVQAELVRDVAGVKFWQLRALAWSAEEADGAGTGNDYGPMRPRLFEGREWYDEDADASEDIMPTYETDKPLVSAASVTRNVPEVPAVDSAISLTPPWKPGAEPITATASVTSASQQGPGSIAPPEDLQRTASHDGNAPSASNDAWEAVFLQDNADIQVLSKRPADGGGQRGMGAAHKQHPVGHPSGTFTLPPPRAPATGQGSSVRPNSRRPHVARPPAPVRVPARDVFPPPPVAAVSVTEAVGLQLQPAKDSFPQTGPEDLGAGSSLPEGTAGRPNGKDMDGAWQKPADEEAAAPTLGREVETTGNRPDVCLAVSEDLAYIHRGSSLQSYAITGSVLLSASGAPLRLRVTDQHGHIATANPNSTYVTATSSTPPTRHYSCKAVPAPTRPSDPKFFPAFVYRCSSAVKNLPVRVTCRLRLAGVFVLVWVQVIANPQLSQPLSGVSVLVQLPFSPRQDQAQGGVQSEPPATCKADRRVLEWNLSGTISPGSKQVLQARLVREEGEGRPAVPLPPTAPAMVKCHLLDTMFSSVGLDVHAVAGSAQFDATPGRVMKRCRVQCRQQG